MWPIVGVKHQQTLRSPKCRCCKVHDECCICMFSWGFSISKSLKNDPELQLRIPLHQLRWHVHIGCAIALFLWGTCSLKFTEEERNLAFSVLPLIFRGRAKGMRGKCNLKDSLPAFIDFQPVSIFLRIFQISSFVI